MQFYKNKKRNVNQNKIKIRVDKIRRIIYNNTCKEEI